MTNTTVYNQWYNTSLDSLIMAPMSNDGLVTVDTGGCVRLWETSLVDLEHSIAEWRGLIGEGDSRKLQVQM